MNRIVITPWGGKHENFLKECRESVAESGIEHLIVRCGPDWEIKMFELRNSADYVAWVDADDIVYPGALEKAFKMAEETEVGLVYTDERLIDKDGVEFCKVEGHCNLFDICSKPTLAHHLSITKRNSITNRVLDLYERTRCPLDWAMRVDAAINCGHRHCPIIGYGYRWHGDQIISQAKFHEEFTSNFYSIIKTFRSWAWPDGIISLES